MYLGEGRDPTRERGTLQEAEREQEEEKDTVPYSMGTVISVVYQATAKEDAQTWEKDSRGTAMDVE